MTLPQLEKTTAQEIADRLEKQGYSLSWEVKSASGQTYDLVARRGAENIAYEIKRQSALASENAQISQLRRDARADGFTDFRLVVVPDTRFSYIEIQGLETQIGRYLQTHPLDERARVFAVANVRIEAIQAHSEQPGMRIKGVAAAEFRWQNNDEEYDCPLHFDLKLNAQWEIEEVFELRLDLSSLSEVLPV